jgi:hypothetical protein
LTYFFASRVLWSSALKSTIFIIHKSQKWDGFLPDN